MSAEDVRGELERLAERVEAATGPDRQLDALIEAYRQRDRYPDAVAVRMGKLWSAVACKGPGRGWRRYGIFFQHHAYLASLDAAMTLVPEGWHTRIALEDRHSRRWSWTLRGGYGSESQSRAATPALALTAAALRAAALARSVGETTTAQVGGEGVAMGEREYPGDPETVICPLTNKPCDRPDLCVPDNRCIDGDDA